MERRRLQRRPGGGEPGRPPAPWATSRDESRRRREEGAGGPRESPGPPPAHGAGGPGLGRRDEAARPLPQAALEEKRQRRLGRPGPVRQPFLYSGLNVPTGTTPPPSTKSSSPGRSSPKRFLRRAPSPPDRHAPLRSGGASPSLSPSISDSLAGKASPQVNGSSLSEGSVLKSLDELFSGAAGSGDSSSSDFHVNVLSLADLAPSLASQKEGFTDEENVMETSGNLSTELEQKLFLANTQSAFKPPNTTMGKAAALEEGSGETEISEQLSGSSVECSSSEQENPTSAQYSEDFELLSEDAGKQSSSEDSLDGTDAPLHSGLSDPSSPCQPQTGTRRSQSARRIATKEEAVQTNSSSLTPQGLKTAAAIDWIVEGPPIASQVVSMDALEELTTHRPAVSALHDMLKQNLLLIQQFVEASRHLHLSFVALLEEEEFHYHTLEEAKMYIDRHKRPPLTLEQALHELEEQKQVAL